MQMGELKRMEKVRTVGKQYNVTMTAVDKKTGKRHRKNAGYTVSEKALAQRRNNVGLPVANGPEEMDYNSRLIEHIVRVQEIGSQADKHDILSLRSCFMAYIKLCQEDGFPVSNMACYSALGMTQMAFTSFAKKDDPEIRQFAEMVKSVCAMSREAQVSVGKLNPVIGIFWQRNFDGLRNDTEQVQAIQQQDEEYSAGGEKYKEKYKNLIGSDD